jgi:4-hydroxy-2-oxoheptanedioate aldolase
MQWIDRKKLAHGLMAGTFLNLGSATAVEVAAELGFDWLLIDLEHGSGSLADLRGMLLACRHSVAAPIVRIRSVDPDTGKFVMDSGAAGLMYPPQGSRGVAVVTRASHYGARWDEYYEQANRESLVVVQIETPQAVAAAEHIAAIEGVDVLFVGPMDLSVNLGCPGDFTPPHFLAALEQVVAACRQHGKVAGILSRPQLVDQHRQLGFRFLALGSDTGAVQSGLQQALHAMRR